MLLPLSSLGESEVQRGFAQVHNSGSPVKHRAGLPSPPLHFLLSLTTDYSSLLLGSQSHQHHFQMEIAPSQTLPPLPWRLETGKGSIMMTRSWPRGFWTRTKFGVCGFDVNLLAVWHWAITPFCWAANFSCVKTKWYSLQDGWQTQAVLSLWPKLLTLIPPHVQDLFSPMAMWGTVETMAGSKNRIYISGMWDWLQEFGVWANVDVLFHVST